MPFPFLQLIPELRNRIYKECLLHNRTINRTANVALLRVCQQVHNEAKDVLYAHGYFTITITTPAPPLLGSQVTLTGDIHYLIDDNTDPQAVVDTIPRAAYQLAGFQVQPHIESGGQILTSYATNIASQTAEILVQYLMDEGRRSNQQIDIFVSAGTLAGSEKSKWMVDTAIAFYGLAGVHLH